MGGAFEAPTSFEDLLAQVMRISEQTIEECDTTKKQALLCHPQRQAMYTVFCELKEKTAQSFPPEDHEENQGLLRLDNMLLAEGISGSDMSHSLDTDTMGEQTEYKQKLGELRTQFNHELEKYGSSYSDFVGNVTALLREQARIRPIADREVTQFLGIIKKKFYGIQFEIKQKTCEQVMLVKSRFLDARRKRRNFSKKSTEVLNEYFYANLNNPYPSEEIKEELARQCNITVSQVSNWFGNKRIRYKKTIAKEGEDLYATKRAAEQRAMGLAHSGVPAGNYSMLTGTSSGFLPYPPMLPGPEFHQMGGFPFPYPELMAQYQQQSTNQEPQHNDHMNADIKDL